MASLAFPLFVSCLTQEDNFDVTSEMENDWLKDTWKENGLNLRAKERVVMLSNEILSTFVEVAVSSLLLMRFSFEGILTPLSDPLFSSSIPCEFVSSVEVESVLWFTSMERNETTCFE